MDKIEANLAKYSAKLALMKAETAEVKADVKVKYLSQWVSLKKRDDLKDSFEKVISRFK